MTTTYKKNAIINGSYEKKKPWLLRIRHNQESNPKEDESKLHPNRKKFPILIGREEGRGREHERKGQCSDEVADCALVVERERQMERY